jgi:type IV pilus assembly protein PilN
MMHINLLPVKAARRLDTARNELFIMAGIVFAALVAVYAAHTWLASKAATVNQRIAAVKREIEELKQHEVRVEEYKQKASTLERKKQAILDLTQKRKGPAKMLDDLATILTDENKVWLVAVEEKGNQLTLRGKALDHENISDFQTALRKRSNYFDDVHLLLVNATTCGDSGRCLDWSIGCTVQLAAN